MEIGVGIHGEPGRTRQKLATADEITEMLANPILDDLPFGRGDRVLAFVNGMGGTPLIELYVVFNKLAADLRGPRRHDRAQPRRQLHHVARDGGLLDHAAQARRRADPATGTPRSTLPPCAGASDRSRMHEVRGHDELDRSHHQR